MNRKEATKFIGKQIRVVDPLLGSYIGELVDIIAEPKKPWRGKVKIIAVEQYPVQNLSDLKNEIIIRPPFTNNEIYEISGSKIESLNVDYIETSFDESLRIALLNEINHYTVEKERVSRVLSELNYELKRIDPKYQSEIHLDDAYQYYSIYKNKQVYLIDSNNNLIPLSNCPFEFEINFNGKWILVQYDSGLSFIDKHGCLFELNEGAKIRLHKQQFDPYQIFLNELEKPALDSLTNGLSKYDMTHDNCVNCQNTLLNQYLSADEESSFKGVNFISYQSDHVTLLVQHHYEREISKNGDHLSYDRFEFTNDKGKRLLMTYTTEIS